MTSSVTCETDSTVVNVGRLQGVKEFTNILGIPAFERCDPMPPLAVMGVLDGKSTTIPCPTSNTRP